MEALRDRPLFTRVYSNPSEFSPAKGSAYVYGLFEERSEHIRSWADSPDVKKVLISHQGRNEIRTDQSSEEYSLRNRDDLKRLFKNLGENHVYIDITGLSHHVWAPLVRIALEENLRTDAIYVEPATYRSSATPRKGEIFDLSEAIEGIAPIPLFTTLADTQPDQVCLIPLLGFEGTRFAYMIEQAEPTGGKIVPVIGVPGFQVEYPFYTYLGNQPYLESTQAWKNVRFARANCPFSVFYILEDILRAYPYDHIKVAPIGTKPHALGAVLLCASSARRPELVYDHPRSKKQRTTGAAHLLEYALSDFLPSITASI
jgi:hypothetical protein